MSLRMIVLFLVTISLTFLLAGVVRVLYVLGPEALVVFYIIILFSVVMVTVYVFRLDDRRPTVSAIVVGLILGVLLDVVGELVSTRSEIFEPRRAAIEKTLMNFQAAGCKDARLDFSGVTVHLMSLNISQPTSEVLVLSSVDQSEIKKIVPEASYQKAIRVSKQRGLGWMFNLLTEGVYAWDIRQAKCIRQ